MVALSISFSAVRGRDWSVSLGDIYLCIIMTLS
jgi:hypothetical protein